SAFRATALLLRPCKAFDPAGRVAVFVEDAAVEIRVACGADFSFDLSVRFGSEEKIACEVDKFLIRHR
ncbi:MAG: hypothetical protein LC730_01960, partial [Acidobacteria bacterium]|nr:hypothetical protein [Acidobacteriota bacterium]